MPPIAVLVALADPTRCRIIEILHQGPQPVHVLASSFDISRPAISRHLRVLKQARLISEKKTGRENRYALHAEKLHPVGDWVAQMQLTGPDPLTNRAVTKAKKPAPPRAPKAAVVAAPAPKVEPLPVIIPAPSAPKPGRGAPVSQMGFDF